jgi:polyhydroxyalkanoate synthase
MADGVTLRDALLVVAALGVAGNSVLLAMAYAVRWRATDHRWLRPIAGRRLLRWYRSSVVRYLLWWLSWPRLVEHLLPKLRAPYMATPSVVVWQQGRATLARFTGTWPPPGGDAVVVVHSVVTRPWILDLLPGRSVIGALAEAGHDVYLLDFGDPGPHDWGQGIGGHATVLADAVSAVAKRSATGKVHVVGYCMGATLALAAVGAWGPGPVKSLTLIAPPYDTEVPGGMADSMRAPALTPVLALDQDGCVPGAYIREAFHLLRRQALKAALARLRKRKDREFQQVAGALSRWALEQRRMPGRLWFDLVDLFRGNTLLRGELKVGKRDVRLDRVTVPTLILVTDRDHIVPIASSLALTRAIPHAEVVRCPAGHVSMLMGHESRAVTIPALLRWLREGTVAPPPPADGRV